MYHMRWFFLLILMFLITACMRFESEPPAPSIGDPNDTAVPSGSEIPPWNTYAPAKGDESKARGDVAIDSLSILVENGFPPAYSLQVKGSLPSPCHELRALLEAPDRDSEIRVQLYSVYDPYAVCAQAAQPFDAVIPLGNYVRGSYTVFLNGREVGTITP